MHLIRQMVVMVASALLLAFSAAQDIDGRDLVASSPPETIDLLFNLTSGSYDNYFLRSNLTAAQVLLTTPAAAASGSLNRFLVAFPAGNSGSVAYFLPDESKGPSNSSSLTVTLAEPGLAPAHGPNSLAGVQGKLILSESATLGTILLGSVRTLRDYTEGNGLTHEIFNWTVTQADNSTIWLSQPYINETVVRDDQGKEVSRARYSVEWLLRAEDGSSFRVTPSTKGSRIPPKIDIAVPSGSKGTIHFVVQTNDTALRGLSVDQLFQPGSQASSQPDAQSQVSFLTFASKFTAGGWRFLTYFGRDTSFTARLLMNNKTLTPFAVESVLGGMLERINYTSGEICHEETIGDYASFVNIQNGQPEKGNEPFYDYKMKDTFYVLLPQLADYLLRYNGTSTGVNSTVPSPQARQFLARSAKLQNGTSYQKLLESNVNYVMRTSQAFARDPRASNLARIKVDVPVGNWRDSNQGLGGGVYPYDVSTALVPAALYAIADLAKAGLLDAKLACEAEEFARVWEIEAPKFFAVCIPQSQITPRLEQYIQFSNLSSSLLRGRGSLNDSPGKGHHSAAHQKGHHHLSNHTFYALSLLEDGTPVPVLHSDLGFNLLFNREISRETMQAVVDALQPYPRGLLTNIGMLVANPAYAGNLTLASELDRSAYHGTVSWGFQTNFMASGLDRVISVCQGRQLTAVARSGLARPDWCDDKHFVGQIVAAQNDLWQAINGAYEERFAEVWSWTFSNATQRFSVTALGDLSPEGTESDAVQLWSYGLLGVSDPTL